MNKIKILIAEDHTLVAKLIAQMLSKEGFYDVVGSVPDGESAVKSAKEKKADVVLMDVDMPGIDGIKATAEIKKAMKNVKVIMLSNHIEAPLIQKALRAGANGYLSKFAEVSEVIDAINSAMKGETYYCKTSMKAMMDYISNQDKNESIQNACMQLTSREKEILNLVAKEYTTKEISHKLILSERTIETHRRNIMKKLGVKNTAGLMKLSSEHHLLE